jgi:hypothetical protein
VTEATVNARSPFPPVRPAARSSRTADFPGLSGERRQRPPPFLGSDGNSGVVVDQGDEDYEDYEREDAQRNSCYRQTAA